MEQVQRTESLGVLAGGIAHDFNNLLATILANTAVLRTGGVASTDVDSCLADVEIAARTAAGLCQQMLAYAGRAPIRSELVDLSELVKDLMQLLRSALSRKLGLDLQLEDKLALVRGDPSQLRQVVMNLVINAAEAMETATAASSSPLALCTRVGTGCAPRSWARSSKKANISCSRWWTPARDGPGDPAPDLRALLHEQVRRARAGPVGRARNRPAGRRGHRDRQRAGSGHPLPSALPGIGRVGEEGPAPAPMANTWTGKGMVLVVDDEPAVRRAAGRLLSRIGFEMLEAAGGAEGVELFTAHAKRIRAVLLDLTMPTWMEWTTFPQAAATRSGGAGGGGERILRVGGEPPLPRWPTGRLRAEAL